MIPYRLKRVTFRLRPRGRGPSRIRRRGIYPASPGFRYSSTAVYTSPRGLIVFYYTKSFRSVNKYGFSKTPGKVKEYLIVVAS
jgi:hypothetical protein